MPTSSSEIHRQLDLWRGASAPYSDYVEKPNDAKLIEVRSTALSALNHSAYLIPRSSAMQDQTTGQPGGLGLEARWRMVWSRLLHN
jgi:hypothetical protein